MLVPDNGDDHSITLICRSPLIPPPQTQVLRRSPRRASQDDNLRRICSTYREHRTTIRVLGPITVPAAGACSRTVPLPLISTSSPAVAAVSITLRTGSPISSGTLRSPSAVMTTAFWGEVAGGGGSAE